MAGYVFSRTRKVRHMRADKTMPPREGIDLRCSRSFAYGILIFILAVALPQERLGGTQPEAQRPLITFKHTARGEGTAKVCREVASSDGKVVLKVEGPNLKGNVRLYEAATNKPLGPVIVLSEPGLSYRLTSLAIAPDHKTVATAMGNLSNDWGQVTVWNAVTGKQVARFRGPPDLGEVFSLSFSDDGKVVSITSVPAGGR